MHRDLRSARDALELLASFKKLQARGAVQQQMLTKSRDVLAQLGREVDAVAAAFHAHKARTSLAC